MASPSLGARETEEWILITEYNTEGSLCCRVTAEILAVLSLTRIAWLNSSFIWGCFLTRPELNMHAGIILVTNFAGIILGII